jgi:hypothetical protein
MKKLLAVSLLLFSGCATVQIPAFRAHITLPASGDGYYVNTILAEEGRIPKAEWDEKKKRGIVLLSEDWEKLKVVVIKNCLTNKACKDTVGVFDDLFKTIDEALKVVTKPVTP